MRKHLSFWLVLAAGGLALPATRAAEDIDAEGVVRLGNTRPSATSPETADTGTTQQVGFLVGYGDCSDGVCGESYGPSCGDSCGIGSPGGCGYGACGYGGCGYGACGGCGHCKTCDLLHGLRSYPVGGCHYSPDHGWAPPGKHPRPRLAATYRRWFPAGWTGEPLEINPRFRYPMVYTPTDTTQLGYYHQRVPVWQRRAGMIPPVPHPDTFHVPDHGVYRNGVVDAVPCGYEGRIIGDYGSSGYAEGDVYSGDEIVPSTPSDAEPAVEAPPVPNNDESAEPYVPGPSDQQQSRPVPPTPAPEAPPAGGPNASGLEKSALGPFLYSIPQ